MCFKTGLLPEDPISVTAGQWRNPAKSLRAALPRAFLALVCFLVLLVSTTPARGDSFLSLAEAERLALADEPGRRALEVRAEALGGEALAAEALPAPTLRLGLNNYPIERGDFSTEGMTSAGLTYRQAFPPGDVRQLRRERYDWVKDYKIDCLKEWLMVDWTK